MIILSTIDIEAAGLRSERMASLADQFEKLRCKTNIQGPIDKMSVIPTKYPFAWCIKKLGWTVEETKSGQHHIYSGNGAFKLEHIWRGVDYLIPIGADWYEK